jgi:amidase
MRHWVILTVALPALVASLPAHAQSAPPFNFMEATIDSIHGAMKSGTLTCVGLVHGYLDRIAAYDQKGPKLNAVQTVNPDALKEAAALDEKFKASGFVGPLHCIPVLLKDEVETKDMPTTYGSALFKHFVSDHDATIVTRMKAAGAIILAKTNLGEFAAGYSGSAFGECHNAYDPTRSPSGSSCGTGAGLAANFATVGIGEDTAGSVRGPAAHESLVGLRPTLPLVSRYGLMPSTPTRDTLGPMARTVRDTAILLDAIAGYDPNDPVTARSYGRVPKTYTAFLDSDGLKGMRFGVIREPIGHDADPNAADSKEVQAALSQAIADMKARGAEFVDPLTIPRLKELMQKTNSSKFETESAVNAYLGAHSNAPVHTLKEIVDSKLVVKARRDRLRDSLGHTTQEIGYLQESQDREALRTIVLQVMADDHLDALIYPTFDHAPAVIPKDTDGNNRLLAPVLAYPAIAVQAGYFKDGMPLGIDFLGRPFSDGILIKAAYAYEQATHHRHPSALEPALPNQP